MSHGDDSRDDMVIEAIRHRLKRARLLHAKPIGSRHEALGIIREEYVEAEQEVFKRVVDLSALLNELLDLAAMCARSASDLNLVPAHSTDPPIDHW